MPLVTLFTAPKAFTDPEIARTQRNAIGSWTHIPDVAVLLLGNDDGIASAARDLSVHHIHEVSVNPNRVPLISSMLDCARRSGDSPFLAIVNADIILTPDFSAVVRDLASLQSSGQLPDGFLLVSRRWDLTVSDALDFSSGWEERLRARVAAQGQLHRPTGSDIFLFPRAGYSDMPNFAIGRAGWDNWMIYHARQQQWPVLDATRSMLVVHQAHDYRHLPGAQPHYNHPDTKVNTRLAGGQAAIRYSILDATHELVSGRLVRPRPTFERSLRGLELFLRRLLFFLPPDAVENVVRPRRWLRRLKRLFGRAVD